MEKKKQKIFSMAKFTTPISPFLHPGTHAKESSLAILHLKRDHLLPTFLHEIGEEQTGYAEGNVTNTRFGSFPHSTLIDQAWGSQIIASKVDTGSRGRKDVSASSRKRKIDAVEDGALSSSTADAQLSLQVATAAASGFCHILPPTPEGWTISLPHRTQVVYTPDYSYVLQQLRVRPGSVVIEAGAGSGSFTHAAARAVFNGYNTKEDARGKVYSFEYHQSRVDQLRREIAEHGLSSIVRITHRDVYTDGFCLLNNGSKLTNDASMTESDAPDSASETISASLPVKATQIFLDLPAPWQALPNLSRHITPSPLDPTQAVHLCAFLPCIEQVTRTIAALRSQGWLEVSMQELFHRRIDVRRERIGLDLEGQRGVNSMPATVDEAVERLKEVEQIERRYRERSRPMTTRASVVTNSNSTDNASHTVGENQDSPTNSNNKKNEHVVGDGEADAESIQTKSIATKKTGMETEGESKAARLARLTRQMAARQKTVFREGRLVHRTEPELKTHTSYLVFAVLPREWTDEDEAAARSKWPLLPDSGTSRIGRAGGRKEEGERRRERER